MISTAAGPHIVVAVTVVDNVVVARLIWPGVVGIPLGSLKISAAAVPSCGVTPSPSARISTDKFQWFKDWKVGTQDRFTFRSCHWRYRHNRSRRDYQRTHNVVCKCRESALLYGTMVELWCVPNCYWLDIRAILTSCRNCCCISVEAQDQQAQAGVRPGRWVSELSSS